MEWLDAMNIPIGRYSDEDYLTDAAIHFLNRYFSEKYNTKLIKVENEVGNIFTLSIGGRKINSITNIGMVHFDSLKEVILYYSEHFSGIDIEGAIIKHKLKDFIDG